MANKRHYLLKGAALGLSGFLAAGCSIMNPHVTADMKRPVYGEVENDNDKDKNKNKDKKLPGVEFAGGVATAIDYANSWRNEYYDSVGEQSMLTNSIALAAIPASATALYFGVSGDAGRETITGIATGVAGLVGLGTFLDGGNARQLVYLAGHRAMGCVILAARPLLMPQKAFDKLTADIPNLETALAAAKSARDNLAAIDPANSFLTELDANIGDSEAALAGAYALKGQIQRAGIEIITRVDTVVAMVSEQVVKTEPNLAAITDIAGGLAGASQKLVNIPKATSSVSSNDAVIKLENTSGHSISDLKTAKDANAALAEATIPIASLVNEYATLAKSVEKIESCKIDAAKVGLAVQPAKDAITIKKGQSYSFAISGGKAPYAASPIGVLPANVSVALSPFNQQPASVTISTDEKKSGVGSFAIAVSDAAGETLVVNVTVQ